jgi:hypothetical protein
VTDEVAPWIYLASSLPEVTYAVGRIAFFRLDDSNLDVDAAN